MRTRLVRMVAFGGELIISHSTERQESIGIALFVRHGRRPHPRSPGNSISGCRARIVTNPLLWATVLGIPKAGIATWSEVVVEKRGVLAHQDLTAE